jgi:ATP synthase protein I
MSNEPPDDLGDRISRAKAERDAREAAKVRKSPTDEGNTSAGAYALRFGAEFVANVFVGGFLGYWIDYFAGTRPWGLLIGGAFGFAAGIRGIIRAYHELNARAQVQAKPEPGASDDGKKQE